MILSPTQSLEAEMGAFKELMIMAMDIGGGDLSEGFDGLGHDSNQESEVRLPGISVHFEV